VAGPTPVGECHAPQPVGKPCMPLLPGQCEAGLLCIPASPGGLQPDGTCREAGSGAAGAPCIGDGSCSEGLVCQFSLGASSCVDPADVTVSPDGGPCGTPSEVCDDGLVCNEAYSPPHCIPTQSGQAGDPCATGLDCQEGLLCNVGLESPACVAAGSMGPGEPCKGPLLAQDAFCTEGASCNTGPSLPVCVADGTVEQSEPCSGDNHCEGELLCAGTPRLCTPPATDGEICTGRKPCRKGLICKDASGGIGTCGAP
jgi:hypothetical protein